MNQREIFLNRLARGKKNKAYHERLGPVRVIKVVCPKRNIFAVVSIPPKSEDEYHVVQDTFLRATKDEAEVPPVS